MARAAPLSPLSANIVLDDPDKELERRGRRFARYADDFLILVRRQRAAERIMAGIKRLIEHKLKVNENKSQLSNTDQTNFLGFTF